MTIPYDRPVLDLIAGLDATGHVTHSKHRKDMVTIHHNGGVLTHRDVLSVWRTRPASAHFNVDAAGTVAQFVRENEYAWSTGTTEGNQRSISIEMCNAAGPPEWRVGEATWRSAARLTGWLFAKYIGVRPTTTNLVPHQRWSSTACPGPFMMGRWGEFMTAAQAAYDAFVAGGAPIDQEDSMTPEQESRLNNARELGDRWTVDQITAKMNEMFAAERAARETGDAWTVAEIRKLLGEQIDLIDESRFVDELSKRGISIGGATPAELKEAVKAALREGTE